MTDREKIIREFERFMQEYERDIGCTSYDCEVLKGVHELLKRQAPHVLAPEELPEWDGAFLIEVRGKDAMVWASWHAEYELYEEAVFRMVDRGGGVDDRFKKLYGYEWRCWTSRPSDEQRVAEPWEG